MATAVQRNLVLRDPGEAVEAYAGAPEVAFDLETGGLRPQSDAVHVVSLAAPGLPPAVLHVRGEPPLPLLRLLKGKRLVGHNTTVFDVPFLYKYGVVPGDLTWDDTLVLEQLAVVSNRSGVSKSLKASLARRVGKRIVKSADHSAWSADHLDDEQVRYCADDVSHVLRLRDEQVARVRELGAEDALQLERDAHRAVAWMTVNGVPVDAAGLLANTRDCVAEAATIREGLYRGFGLDNPGSHVQVKAAVEERFGLALTSTDASVMGDLALRPDGVGEFARVLLHYRSLLKAAMYDSGWLEAYAPDGRIYPRYWQLGTDTGRMSASDPNVQQWPAKMRRFIAAPSGHLVVSADFSQIEVVVGALLYRDPALLEAVRSEDVHTTVAALLFDVDPSTIDRDSPERRLAKAASFTFLFGGGLPGMRAATLGTGIEDARLLEAQRRFNARFPTFAAGLRGYQSQINAANARGLSLRVKPRRGPVRSLWGPGELTLQRVTNSLIQGTAASVIKRALHLAVEAGLGPYLTTAIHDELVLVVPEGDEAVRATWALHDAMAQAALDVLDHEVRVKPKVGRNLADEEPGMVKSRMP